MPIVFLLIGLLFFNFFSLTFLVVTKDNIRSQHMVESNAAFFTADSGISEALEVNEGREVMGATEKKSSSDLFFGPYELSSGEVLLDQNIDFFRLDYCLKNTSCPELIIEWFEFEKDMPFQSLATLKNKVWPSAAGPCLDYSDIGIRRCALRTSLISTQQLSVSDQAGEYQRLLKFQTFFATGKNYLFRFKTIDGTLIVFELSGEKAGKRVGIPNVFSENDSSGQVQNISRRIRHQKQVFSGLQDRLWYAHYAEEMAEK